MNMFKKNGGFTLVELIVVIAILAILAGVAIPAYSGYITKAQEAADTTTLSAIKTAATAAKAEDGAVTGIKVITDGEGTITAIWVNLDGKTETEGDVDFIYEPVYGPFEFNEGDAEDTEDDAWTALAAKPADEDLYLSEDFKLFVGSLSALKNAVYGAQWNAVEYTSGTGDAAVTYEAGWTIAEENAAEVSPVEVPDYSEE